MEESTVCLNCDHTFTGRYCNECGEKVIIPDDRSFKSMMIHLSEALFSLDNKFLRSFKFFLKRPGSLTFFYSYGPRKKYLTPLSLFIIFSVIYFLFPVFQTFNSTLNTHLNFGFYSETASRMVMEYTQGNDQKFNEYMLAFNESTGNYGKIAIFIFIVFLTMPLAILNHSKNHYLADHAMLSFEVNAFLILLNTLILPIIVVIGSLFGLKGINGDEVMGPILAVFTICYLSAVHIYYYKNKWWMAIFKSGILMLSLLYILYLYRCVVFFVTHWNIT